MKGMSLLKDWLPNCPVPCTLYLAELDDVVEESGCRDEVATTGVLKTISWSARKQQRRDDNEIISLQKMIETSKRWLRKRKSLGRKLFRRSSHTQKVSCFGLWRQSSFSVSDQEDIVYLDTIGSIIKKAKGESTPHYVYKMVVRHPAKDCSPVPVATYVTSDDTTSSVSYFLGVFITDCIRCHGRHIKKRPVMYICDGSVVLMQSIA